jgi:predicted site-specific integrase-resolvase
MKRENLVTKAPTKGVLLLSRWQVAEKLAVSIDTIKRMERRGQLRPIRLNSRMIRYRLSDVDAMMAAHESGVAHE